MVLAQVHTELSRGKSLPLKISKDSSAKQVLEEALKKREAYDRTFRSELTYKLCYPDGTEVITLPGSESIFTLEKYKEDLGKTWGRITFLLCPVVENYEWDLDQEITDQEDDDLLISDLFPDLDGSTPSVSTSGISQM